MASKIVVETGKAVQLLTELEYLVVSLDRIGSAALSQDVRADELDRFVVNGEVFQRLAAMRRILMEAVDECLSPGERGFVEERLEEVQPWVLSHR